MNKLIKLILYFIAGISLPFLLSSELQNVVADIIDYRIYLPMVSKSEVIPTPSPTHTPHPPTPNCYFRQHPDHYHFLQWSR